MQNERDPNPNRRLLAAVLLLALAAGAVWLLWDEGPGTGADDASGTEQEADDPGAEADLTVTTAGLTGRGATPESDDAANETKDGEAELVSVVVRVLRRGRPVPGIEVSHMTNPPSSTMRLPPLEFPRTGTTGEVELLLRPGTYLVSARSRTEKVEAVSRRAPARVDIVLPATEIRVRVVDATTSRGVPNVSVVVDQIRPGRKRPRRDPVDRKSTDGQGEVVFRDMDLGDFHVYADTQAWKTKGDRWTKLTESNPAVDVQIEAHPVGRLAIQLENRDGRLEQVSSALHCELYSEESGKRYARTGPTRHGARADGRTLEFGDLPPGRYRVLVRDQDESVERQESVRRHQPIDPIDHSGVQVRHGEVKVLRLPITYRAYVRIAGARGTGKLDRGLTVSVRAEQPGKSPRLLPGPWQRGHMSGGVHFDGYLAPGIYVVELKRKDGRSWTERLVVAREAIRVTYTVPWAD